MVGIDCDSRASRSLRAGVAVRLSSRRDTDGGETSVGSVTVGARGAGCR